MLAFARIALLRLVRDRTNVFFVVLFPLLVVLLIGMQFGPGLATTIGITDGPLAADLRARLEADGLDVRLLPDAAAARREVEDGALEAALVLPAGRAGEIGFVAAPGPSTIALRQRAAAAVAALDGPARAARALVAGGVAPDVGAGDALVAAVPASVREAPVVTATTVGADDPTAEFAGLGQFDLGASTQLLLFVFITAATGSIGIVQARRWGVLDRVLAGPTSPAAVIAGLGLGQLAVAGTQAVVVVAATALLFDVSWGDPLASTAVVVAFSLVAAATGLLLGALLRNEEQVSGVAVPLGLGLAAIGGSMVPLEVMPAGLRTVALATPHAWGNRAFAEIVRRDGGIADVLPELAALLAFAVVVGGAASLLLRRRLLAAG